jgi:hypothetical protein
MSDYETLHSRCISLRINSTLLAQINIADTTLSKTLNTDISNTIIGLAIGAKERTGKGLPADLP